MKDIVYTSVVVVGVSALTIGSLAYFCAKRESVVLFLALVLLLLGAVAWAVEYFSTISSLTPNRISEWRSFVATFLGMAPQALLPAAFTIAAVFGRVEVRRIPLLAISGAVVALPFTFFTALASSCYVAYACP